MKLSERLGNAPKKRRTIVELYPQLSQEEQREAEYNLRRYIRLVRRIFERIRRENPKALTDALKEARLKESKPEQ
ncbi:MAG: hypothetical protein M3209_17655 [Acidobacteriota bacterium]|nr:hypothetical protein [Acidobacteriota bacterium]